MPEKKNSLFGPEPFGKAPLRPDSYRAVECRWKSMRALTPDPNEGAEIISSPASSAGCATPPSPRCATSPPSALFPLRRRMVDGGREAVMADEEVVPIGRLDA